MADENTLSLPERPVYFGGAIKALGNGLIEGILVPFTSPERKDLHQQYFSKRTNLYLGDYPHLGLQTMYQHGLDPTFGIRRNGLVKAADMQDVGSWIRAQLELRDEYEQAVYELAERGVLSWSSGALPQSVRVAPDGHIDDWAVIEPSLTPTPAMPYLTRVNTLKSLVEDVLKEARPIEVFVKSMRPSGLGDGTPSQTSVAAEPPDAQSQESQPTEDQLMDMERIAQLIQDRMNEVARIVIEELGSMLGAAPADAETMGGYMAEEAQRALGTEEEQKALTEAKLGALLAEKQASIIAAATKRFAQAKQSARKAITDAAKAGLEDQARNAPARTARTDAGGYNANGSNGGGRVAPNQIRMLRLKSKWGNLSPEAISYALDTQRMYRRKEGRPRFRPGRSDEGMLTVAQIFANQVLEQQTKGAQIYVSPSLFAKAVDTRAIKANELDHTTQTNYGAEWIWTYWRDQIWEKARLENTVLQQFTTVEMQAKVEEIPVEWTDPEVSYVPESTASASLDPSASPAGYTKIGTNKITFTAKKLMLQVAWSAEEEEDSIIRFSENAQRQSTRAMMNAIDYVILNGDTETGTTNINKDGAAPGAKDKYLAVNGVIKLALVTGSGLKLDAGGAAPLLSTIREARFKMGREFNTDTENIVMWVHPEAYMGLLNIDEFLTMDKAGDLATNRKGQLGVIDGIAVLRTAQMVLSATNGKVSNTGGNNLYGRIPMAYTPYWKIGFRRQVRSTLKETLDGEAWVLTMSTRLDVETHPENNGASVLYDLAV